MSRKGNPHSDASNTPGERQSPRGGSSGISKRRKAMSNKQQLEFLKKFGIKAGNMLSFGAPFGKEPSKRWDSWDGRKK